jgi:hypothetical protein
MNAKSTSNAKSLLSLKNRLAEIAQAAESKEKSPLNRIKKIMDDGKYLCSLFARLSEQYDDITITTYHVVWTINLGNQKSEFG